ncbi:MAG: hypothetical protein ACR2IK_14150 [Chloroflexota bacterium]
MQVLGELVADVVGLFGGNPVPQLEGWSSRHPQPAVDRGRRSEMVAWRVTWHELALAAMITLTPDSTRSQNHRGQVERP